MQTTNPLFEQQANADIRPLSWGARISFTKEFDDDVTFFTLDQSELNGVDVLAPSDDNPIQAWDYYKYGDFTERLVYESIERSLEFPYSVVSAIADFQLNNYDKYFTPNGTSTIADYILPKRPVRLLQGFGNTTLQQFVGLTQGMPEIDREAGTATFTAMDFLTWIYDMPIRNTESMINKRTDEILANIFTQFGLAPEQYDLAVARNTVPYLFFTDEQTTAGDIIRPLMQAEGGSLWLDEEGIIRFRPRLEQPTTPVYYFDADSIISLETEGDDTIINHIIINAEPRALQEPQVVYSTSENGGGLTVIPASSSLPVNLSLSDPVENVDLATLGELSGNSWFTATDTNGDPVTSNITVTGQSYQTNSQTLFFNNTNGFDVIINNIVLWGEPAKIIGNKPLIYDAYDDVSVDKYEEKILTIDNNFIQSVDQAESLALTILDEYAEYSSILNLEVKGTPALQLSDVVELDYEEFSGEYRIVGIKNKTQDNKFTQQIRVKGYNPRHWFTLDQSLLDSTEVLAP